jgi:mycofactocin system glycosyltransferase
MPLGLRIVADQDTTDRDAVSLIGGTPRRVLRLSSAGQAAWAELRDGPVRSKAAGVLARRLTDSGLAHPQPSTRPDVLDVTVVIPVRDRSVVLDRCLTALGQSHPVVVIDDGSDDAAAVAAVVRGHGATLISSAANGGPAAARNLGLRAVTTEFVAFLDSDCVAPEGWIERLAAHFDDPLVAAVAPRVVASNPRSGRYRAACGGLDLGDRAARVRPGGRVAYVPTAALLVRRRALDAIENGGAVFDPDLRYGEDVDLVWRLDATGWRIRYDPAIEVRHVEPPRWRDRLARRFRYGTSAAPLFRRHPDALAPLVLSPWPAVVVAGLLSRRPVVVAGGLAAAATTTRRSLRRADLTDLGTTRLTLASIAGTWIGVGRYATQFAAPLVAAALVVPGDRRWSRRLAAVSLLIAPPLSRWVKERPIPNPLRFLAGQLADDVAYGAGVYVGSWRQRTVTPLRPAVSRADRSPRGAR